MQVERIVAPIQRIDPSEQANMASTAPINAWGFDGILASLQQEIDAQQKSTIIEETAPVLSLPALLDKDLLAALEEQVARQKLFTQLPLLVDDQLIIQQTEDVALIREQISGIEALMEGYEIDGEQVLAIPLQDLMTHLLQEQDSNQITEDMRETPVVAILVQMMVLYEGKSGQKRGGALLEELVRRFTGHVDQQVMANSEQQKREEKISAQLIRTPGIIAGKEQIASAPAMFLQQTLGNWHPEGHRMDQSSPLIKQFAAMFKRANFGQIGGANRLSIQLYPEHLGQVRVEIIQRNGLITARVLAATTQGKALLESQLHQLRQAFIQQQIQVERIDIAEMLTEPSYEREEHASKEQLHDQNESGRQEPSEEKKTFEAFLNEVE